MQDMGKLPSSKTPKNRLSLAMQIHQYKLCLKSPAFLGNATQDPQWRTPPVKALLRQWWRVAWAAQHQFPVDYQAMREEEAKLFGHAWLENDRNHAGESVAARKSSVRLRLLGQNKQAGWSKGSQIGVQPLSTGLDTSYAWFGLVKTKGKADRNAIKPAGPEGEQTLAIAAPDSAWPMLQEALNLIDAFGNLGSRSRGGWGALHLPEATSLSPADCLAYTRPLLKCLQTDWAMSLAQDAQGLCIWESRRTFSSWDKAMALIATERRDVRKSLGKELRFVLGEGGNERLPNPLRWKVVPAENDSVRVRVFAMPHAIPAGKGVSFQGNQLHDAWRQVCHTLDNNQNLRRWV